MPYNHYRQTLALLACLLLAGQAPAAGGGAIELTLRGYDGKSPVYAALHAAADRSWEQPLRQQSAATAAIRFADVAPGRYAIRLFVDRDGDGALRLSPRGIPLEPVGFSTNPSLTGGAPAPAAVGFAHEEGITHLTVELRSRR